MIVIAEESKKGNDMYGFLIRIDTVIETPTKGGRIGFPCSMYTVPKTVLPKSCDPASGHREFHAT